MIVVIRLIRQRNLSRQFKLDDRPDFTFNLHIAHHFPGREHFIHFICIGPLEPPFLFFQSIEIIPDPLGRIVWNGAFRIGFGKFHNESPNLAIDRLQFFLIRFLQGPKIPGFFIGQGHIDPNH